MPSESYEKLIGYSFNLISKKRYTVFLMKKKLLQYAKKNRLEEKNIEDVIERLIELSYLDDYQFVIDYINERIKLNPRGINMIKLELKKKGIEKEIVNKGVDSIPIDEISIATSFLTKKMQRWRAHNYPQQKLKAYRFLYSRGFGRDSIYKAIESCYDSLGS